MYEEGSKEEILQLAEQKLQVFFRTLEKEPAKRAQLPVSIPRQNVTVLEGYCRHTECKTLFLGSVFKQGMLIHS